ncbi:MAG: anthranilate synthase component I [Elusimicrobiota bacterium]
MDYTAVKPSLAEFKAYSKQGNLIPVSIDVLADHCTPVSLISAYWDKVPYCFLLESVEGGERLGRYSIVSFEPEAVLVEKDGMSQFQTVGGKVFMRSKSPALETLSKYMRCVKPVSYPGLPRFYGGAVGYFSYETVHHIENLPRTQPDDLGWPEAQVFVNGDMYIFDNMQQTLKLVTCVRLNPKIKPEKQYKDAILKLNKKLKDLKKSLIALRHHSKLKKKKVTKDFKSNVSRPDFMKSVQKAKEYIGKGDIFQLVLSKRLEKETSASPLDIYRSLRVVNPSPYMYLVKMKDRAIIGSSPEALVRLEEGVAMTRPIAGTRGRGVNVQDDIRLEKELMKDAKERAEHLMLVDLGRNDLGRVCQYGSVKVPTLMTIERYSHVMHIVSEVTGKIKSDKDAFDLLKAVFPAGTVSGAPKIRAMEIIDQLETTERGPYAGCLGYFSYSGNMDMAITIRTILWEKGKVSIQTGAGIVADSNPAHEYLETENKAAGMKRTIELAELGHLYLERI